MGTCRIYLFTYQRNNLLPRAIKSLQKQTFTDWICDVHNDDPKDDFPSNYIQSLNDSRFIIKNHTSNLGGTKSFNLAFAGCEENYASILEDDNWWEPKFLQEMINYMDANPTVNVVWNNMILWEELENGEWQNTNKTIWPIKEEVTKFSWPQPNQAMGALHSTGAMMYRGKNANAYAIPDLVLLNSIELVRERSFEYPIALINKPMSNFAITKFTNRSNNPIPWIASQVMLLASFIDGAEEKKKSLLTSLIYYRTQKPTPVANFFLANFFLIKDNSLYLLFNFSDWISIVKWLIKNFTKINQLKKQLEAQEETYQFLIAKTKLRYQESSKN